VLQTSRVWPSGTRVAFSSGVSAPSISLVPETSTHATVAGTLRVALINVALILASLGLACFLGELAVRIIAPQQLIVKRPDIWQPVDTLGWTHRLDVNTTINTGERTVHVFTDQDGFRVGRAGRTEGKRRILLLGDSFMEALQVEYEQSLAGLLEARVGAHLGETVAVRNTGVGGWDPPQYLMEARREIGRERFDLVLVSVYLGNDVVARRVERYPAGPPVDAPFHRLRLPRRLTHAELVDAVFYPINDFLKARSHLFVLLKKQASTLRMRLGLTADYFPDDLLRREASSPRWAVTAQICRDIRDLASVHGVPSVFFLIPAPYQVDTAAFYRALKGFRIDQTAVDLEQPERLLSSAMAVYRLDVVDVLPDFRRAERSGSHLYGSVDPHLSPEGHDVLERLVEPVVQARLAYPPGHVRLVAVH
jgi:hypothetical protein